MANQDRYSPTGPRRDPVTVIQTTPPRAVVHPHKRGRPGARRGESFSERYYVQAYRRLLARHKRLIRRVAIGCAVLVVAPLLVFLGLWWRLSSGPIQIDVVTPWLASAIQDNFGSHDRVEIGGTQIEGTETGGAAVRIRDIVVSDANGAVVAKAP
jgi:hypothetical protein